MTTSSIFLPAGLKVGSTLFSHLDDPSVDAGLDDLSLISAGDSAPIFVGSKQHKPKMTLNFLDLAGVLDLMTTLTWLRSCAAETVHAMFRKVQAHATQYAVGDSEHVKMTATSNALWHWTQISANQGEPAKINTVLTLTYNGTNEPLVLTPSTTLDAPGGAVEPWTLGPVEIDGTAVDGLTNLTWDQQPEVQEIASGGDPTTTFAAITGVRPVIKFDTTDLETIAGYDPKGEEISALTVWFRRMKSASVNYSDASSKHLKLYVTDATPLYCGVLKWRQISARPAKASVEIYLKRSAAGVTLFSYAKNQAIT